MAVEQFQYYLRSKVVMTVGSRTAPLLRWGRSRLPTLTDVELLRPLVLDAGLDCDALLSDTSHVTSFEGSDGNWASITSSIRPPPGRSSLLQGAAAFRLHIGPTMAGAPSTRRKSWRHWRGVLSWAAARRCLERILPMDTVVFEALLWDLVNLHCTFPVIKGYIDCIQARHRGLGLQSPITGANSYARLARGLQRFQGRQRRFKFPIHKSTVALVLSYETSSWTKLRNCLAAALATVCCLRPAEGAALQSCDIFFDFDVASGRPGFEGTAAVNVKSRKNDQLRKGHYPRIGRSYSRFHDLVHQLRCFMDEAGTAPRRGCIKRARPHAHCPVCPPLFPCTARQGYVSIFTDQHPTPDTFSSWITSALGYVGLDTSVFSGVSARRGGLSTAIEAGVPEAVLWMQSGHAQSIAARSYVALNSPTLLYQTWEAFEL